jgi:hypothetical protein
MLALLLGACWRDPLIYGEWNKKSGNWTIERTVDRVTGAPIASAMLATETASNSGADWPGPAMLQITCFDKFPIVRLSFDFKIGSDKNSILGYRFDDKPGRDNVESRILIGYTVIVIEQPAEVAQFVADLGTSQNLFVRIRSLNAGRTVADFKLDGAPAAIEAALGGCPVPPQQPQPPDKKSSRRANS